MKKLFLSLTFAIALMTSCKDDDAKLKDITVNASEITTNAAKITFSSVDGAMGYDVEIAKEGETLEYMETIITEPLEYEAEKLLAGTSYEVKITAVDIKDKSLGEGTYTFKTLPSLAILVGTWESGYEGDTETYVFNEDGTGTQTTSRGLVLKIKWVAEEAEIEKPGKLTITTYAGDYDGTSTSETVDYIYYGEGEGIKIDGKVYFPEN